MIQGRADTAAEKSKGQTAETQAMMMGGWGRRGQCRGTPWGG